MLALPLILVLFPPRYTSEAQLQVVSPERDTATGEGNSEVAARLDKEAINTHVRALMSPNLAREIIADEGLAKKPEFNGAEHPSLLSRILGMFDFSSGKQSEQGEPHGQGRKFQHQFARPGEGQAEQQCDEDDDLRQHGSEQGAVQRHLHGIEAFSGREAARREAE